jgi:DNA-binding LacI/PurR family transcriptional regulator
MTTQLRDITTNPATAAPRVAVISARLREMALAKGPGQKLPPVRELCRILGTSINTLDDALAALETQEVITRRRGSGVYVSPHVHRKSIVVMLDAYYFQRPGVSPYWGMLWGLCAGEAQSRAARCDETYEFRIVSRDLDSEGQAMAEVIADLKAGRLHGALAIGVSTPRERWTELRTLPIVTYAAAGCWMVGGDTSDRHEEALRGLADEGCRRIGVWSPTDLSRFDADSSRPGVLREFAGAQRAAATATAARAGVPLEPRFLCDAQSVVESRNGPFSNLAKLTHQDQGYEAAREMFSRAPEDRPDGLLITDDMMTHGALTAFEELGVRLNRDIRVCSHANVNSIVLYRRADRMARIEIDPEEITRTLFSLLDGLMAGEHPATPSTQLASRYYRRVRD